MKEVNVTIREKGIDQTLETEGVGTILLTEELKGQVLMVDSLERRDRNQTMYALTVGNQDTGNINNI